MIIYLGHCRTRISKRISGGPNLSIHYLICAHFSCSWWDFVTPVTLYKWLVTGQFGLEHNLMLMVFYSLLWVGPMALGFFLWQISLVCIGLTYHEDIKSK